MGDYNSFFIVKMAPEIFERIQKIIFKDNQTSYKK